MTKQDEINLINNFVKTLEDGYLKDIFKDILPMIENAINSDMCFIPYWDLVKQKNELNNEVIQKMKELRQLEDNIKHKRDTNDSLESQLTRVRISISRLAGAI